MAFLEGNSSIRQSFGLKNAELYGYRAWSMPWELARAGASGLINGTLQVARIDLPEANQDIFETNVFSGLTFAVAGATLTPTAAQNFAAVYGSDGTRLWASADITTIIGTTTGGLKTVPFSTGQFFQPATQPTWVPNPSGPSMFSYVYAALLINGSGATSFAGAASIGFAPGTGLGTYGGTASASGQSALPATISSVTPAFTFWVALY